MKAQKSYLPSCMTTFFGVESETPLNLICISSAITAYVRRRNDFTILKGKQQLPSFHNLKMYISEQHHQVTLQEMVKEEAQDIQSMCFFLPSTAENAEVRKHKKDTRVTLSFGQAGKIPKWADPIDRENKVLIDCWMDACQADR